MLRPVAVLCLVATACSGATSHGGPTRDQPAGIEQQATSAPAPEAAAAPSEVAPAPREAGRRPRPRARTGTISVTGAPARAVLTLDGRPFTATRTVPAGRHVFVASYHGSALLTRTIDVAPGEEEVLDLSTLVDSLAPGQCRLCLTQEPDPTLSWLTDQQSDDGSFRAAGFDNAATTSLVLLTLLGAGETHKTGDFKVPIKNALRFLKNTQGTDGRFAAGRGWLRDHAVAALAMTEAYGQTGSRLFTTSAQDAVRVLERERTPGLGWRADEDGDIDLETTVWAVMVLKSARMAELHVDEAAWRDAANIVREIEDVDDPDLPLRHVAMLTFARYLTAEGKPGERKPAEAQPEVDPSIAAGVARLVANPLVHDAAFDPVYAYFGTIAMWQRGGEDWKAWNASVRSAVIDQMRQRALGEPIVTPPSPASRAEGSLRTGTWTTLVQEVYYRYGRVFGGSR